MILWQRAHSHSNNRSIMAYKAQQVVRQFFQDFKVPISSCLCWPVLFEFTWYLISSLFLSICSILSAFSVYTLAFCFSHCFFAAPHWAKSTFPFSSHLLWLKCLALSDLMCLSLFYQQYLLFFLGCFFQVYGKKGSLPWLRICVLKRSAWVPILPGFSSLNKCVRGKMTWLYVKMGTIRACISLGLLWGLNEHTKCLEQCLVRGKYSRHVLPGVVKTGLGRWTMIVRFSAEMVFQLGEVRRLQQDDLLR